MLFRQNSKVTYYIVTIFKSSNWTLDLLNSNYHASLGPLWQLNLLSNKHKWEMQGCVYVVLKFSGFKYQCKPRAFLYRKTLPLVKVWYLGALFSILDLPCGDTCLVGAYISRMAGLRLAFCAPGWICQGLFVPLAEGFLRPWQNMSVCTSLFFYPSIQSSLSIGPRLFSTPTTIQVWFIFDN